MAIRGPLSGVLAMTLGLALLAPAGVGAQDDAVEAASVDHVATSPDVIGQGVEISRAAFPDNGSAQVAVLSRDDLFADSLGGTALAGDRGPILFTGGGSTAALAPATASELRRVLPTGGTVHILGGQLAVSERTERAVRDLGFQVSRLWGETRFETAIAVAEAANPSPERVLLARADDWADAVSGGAFAADSGTPVVLSNTPTLHPATAAYLNRAKPSRVTLLGGEAALSRNVQTAVGSTAQRVAGDDRAGTAVAIASQLWQRTSGSRGDEFVVLEGRAAASWAPALAAAVLSARSDAPQLLMLDRHRVLPVATHVYLRDLGYSRATSGSVTTVGPLVEGTHRTLLRILMDPSSATTTSQAPDPTVPAAPGREGPDGTKAGDGFKVYIRYQGQTGDNYVGFLNTRDERLRIQRKEEGQYPGQPRCPEYRPPYGQRQEATVSAVDNANGSVTVRLFIGDALQCEFTDANPGPLRGNHHVGIRADNVAFAVDEFVVRPATSSGRPTGDPIFRERFSYPNGLLTNQRERSPQNARWNVFYGSIFIRNGQAHSGDPDDVYPDPESAVGNNNSAFRVHTHSRSFGNVAVTVSFFNHGFVPHPQHLAGPPPDRWASYPRAPYPAVTTQQRMHGRSSVHTAIEVSKRGFNRAANIVLMDSSVNAGHLAAPGLAGRRDAPILLTGRSSLHADTATEIRRLRATTAWIVGPLSSGVDSGLRNAGITTIRRLSGSNAPDTAARVAASVGGQRAYLANADDWTHMTSIAGASARLRRPVLLMHQDTLPAVTARAIRDNGITHLTVLTSSNNRNRTTAGQARIVDQLRSQGVTVVYGGFSRYSISRVSAQHQISGGAARARVWLTAGARPTDTLAAGAAAAREGGVQVTIDGQSLNDWDSLHNTRTAPGFEALHWLRYNRPHLRTLRVVGDGQAVSTTVVNRLVARN